MSFKRQFKFVENISYESAIERTQVFVKESFINVPEAKWFAIRDGGADHYWRPLPSFWENAAHWGLDIWVHNNIGEYNSSYLCIKKMKNEACAICDESKHITNQEVLNAIAPRNRVLQLGIDRDNEVVGPLFWAPPKAFDAALMAVATNKKTRAVRRIANPDQGCDVFFKVEGKKPFIKYVSHRCEEPSVLSDDESKYVEWLSYAERYQLPYILKFHNYEFLKDAFCGTGTKEKKSDDRAGVDVVQTIQHTQTAQPVKFVPATFQSTVSTQPTHVKAEPTASAPVSPKYTYDEIMSASSEGLDNMISNIYEASPNAEFLMELNKMNDSQLKEYLCKFFNISAPTPQSTMSPSEQLRARFKRQG